MIRSIQEHQIFIFIENQLFKIVIPIGLFMLSFAFIFNNILLASNAILLILSAVLYGKNQNLIKQEEKQKRSKTCQ